MELYIVRHAWAGDHTDPQYPNDNLRPLTTEGQQRFAAMVAKLAERGVRPQIIATSPLLRCVQTAQTLAAGVPGKPEVVELDDLRPGSDLDGLVRWTVRKARECEQVAWVGHAPDVGRLATALIGASEGYIHFTKGGTAAIRFDGLPTIGGGELRWLVSAKLLGV
jgi:phosphohistidine phosphatase